MNIMRLLAVTAVTVACSSSVMAQSATPHMKDGVLVTGEGMTAYTFDKDVAGSGKSTCNGPCATNWPPIPATSAKVADPYSVVTRDDGSKQLAYKGKPLYLFIADKKPGDRNGDNVKDVWHVVKD